MFISAKENGFTILEIVIVIIIVGILSVFASSRWGSTSLSTDGQGEQIANDIRYAQALAMTRNDRYRFVRTSATTYQVLNSAGTAISLAGGTTTTLGTGISFGAFTNLPSNLVAFDGKGAPYTTTGSPGTALAATGSIPVTSGGNTSTVTITPQTGRVTVQ